MEMRLKKVVPIIIQIIRRKISKIVSLSLPFCLKFRHFNCDVSEKAILS